MLASIVMISHVYIKRTGATVFENRWNEWTSLCLNFGCASCLNGSSTSHSQPRWLPNAMYMLLVRMLRMPR